MKENDDLIRVYSKVSSHASIATRHSLLTRLKNWEDQEGWKRFFDTYWRLIYGVAVNAGLTEVEAQEVVQETVISVANKIKGLRFDSAAGSFKSWLFQLTTWRITDQFRKRRGKEVPLEPVDPATGTAGDWGPQLQLNNWDQHWKENLAEAALERLRDKISVKAYQVFDLHVTRGWPVNEVARVLGISAGQVYLTKFRTISMLKKEVKRLESELF